MAKATTLWNKLASCCDTQSARYMNTARPKTIDAVLRAISIADSVRAGYDPHRIDFSRSDLVDLTRDAEFTVAKDGDFYAGPLKCDTEAVEGYA